MGNYQLLIIRWPRGRKWLRELPHPQRGDDGHDISIVREVEVEGLVEREGGGHGVEGYVCLGCAGGKLVEMVL
jgi:hypothetical protein